MFIFDDALTFTKMGLDDPYSNRSIVYYPSVTLSTDLLPMIFLLDPFAELSFGILASSVLVLEIV